MLQGKTPWTGLCTYAPPLTLLILNPSNRTLVKEPNFHTSFLGKTKAADANFIPLVIRCFNLMRLFLRLNLLGTFLQDVQEDDTIMVQREPLQPSQHGEAHNAHSSVKKTAKQRKGNNVGGNEEGRLQPTSAEQQYEATSEEYRELRPEVLARFYQLTSTPFFPTSNLLKNSAYSSLFP